MKYSLEKGGPVEIGFSPYPFLGHLLLVTLICVVVYFKTPQISKTNVLLHP